MGLVVSSVNNGVITLSNGQKITSGATVPNNGGVVTPPTNPYAPFPTQQADTAAFGLGLNGAASPAGPQTVRGPAAPLIDNGPGSALGDAERNAASGLNSAITKPPPPPPPPPPAPVDYYAQYESALGASRANLENQYVQAQSSIDKQQQDANATLMQVPGQFNTIDKNSQADTKLEDSQILAADTKAGMGGTAGSGGALANAQAEMNAAGRQNAAANKALIPTLGLGIKTQMDAERASLADAKSGAEGALDAAAMNVAASRASQASSEANSTAQEKIQHNQAVSDATTAYKRQLTLAEITSGVKLNDSSTKVPGMTVGDEKAVATSPYFAMVTNELNTGKMTDGKPATAKSIGDQLATLASTDTGSTHIAIPGFSGNAGMGLLQVLKSYYGANFGLTK